MPTTVTGLLLFVLYLVPGFLYVTQRRARTPQPSVSPLVETANLVTVSTFTNLLAVLLFGVVRYAMSAHTPDPRRMVVDGWSYTQYRLPYVGLWAIGLLGVSSAAAFILGRRPRWIERFSVGFAPSIVDISAWYQAFEDGPPDCYVFVGCDLRDGSYVDGLLDWYSTEVAETADRDLLLAEPIRYRAAGTADAVPVADFSRLILSARDISRLYVTFLSELPEWPATTADPPDS